MPAITDRPAGRAAKIGWFVLLWLGGVASVAGLAYAVRGLMALANG